MKKDTDTIITIMLLNFIVAFIGNAILRLDIHKSETQLIEKRFNQLDSIMQHRSQLDSLYWNHLEECSFELKESLVYTENN